MQPVKLKKQNHPKERLSPTPYIPALKRRGFTAFVVSIDMQSEHLQVDAIADEAFDMASKSVEDEILNCYSDSRVLPVPGIFVERLKSALKIVFDAARRGQVKNDHEVSFTRQ
jgi:hypothetical protein